MLLLKVPYITLIQLDNFYTIYEPKFNAGFFTDVLLMIYIAKPWNLLQSATLNFEDDCVLYH